MNAEARIARAMRRAATVPGLPDAIADAVEAITRDGGRAARDWERFHWGRSADRTIRWEAPAVEPWSVLRELGDLAELAYDTRKDERALWVHRFGRPRPVLASTESGQLIVVGGAYRITARGIVG